MEGKSEVAAPSSHRGVRVTALVHGMKVFESDSVSMNLMAQFNGGRVDVFNPDRQPGSGVPQIELIFEAAWLSDFDPDDVPDDVSL